MTGNLRLGPLPRADVVRLTLSLPAALKSHLDLYAELYSAAYEKVDAAKLIPHMLIAFMERDRTFRKARQTAVTASARDPSSASTEAATSRTSDTTGDGSPSA